MTLVSPTQAQDVLYHSAAEHVSFLFFLFFFTERVSQHRGEVERAEGERES